MKRSKLLAALLAVLLGAAACSSSDSDAESSDTESSNTDESASSAEGDSTSDAADDAASSSDAASADSSVESDDAAEAAGSPIRIVSMSATATESLFAMGAGDQVVAVDDQSNYPAEAPAGELSAFTPNVEAIAGFEPDLVVISFDPGGLEEGLIALGIEVLVQGTATDLDDAYSQIEQLGAATGHVGDAAELVLKMEGEISALSATALDDGPGGTFFHEVSNTLFSATSATFVGQIYGLAGLTNIADATDPDGEFQGFPEVSEEYVIDQNPDFIFLADADYGESAETVAARPGWEGLAAVTNGHVVPLDADISSRWGPRIPEFLEFLVTTTVAAPAG